MASKTITQLTALDTVSTNLANTLFVVYDTETGTTKKASLSQIDSAVERSIQNVTSAGVYANGAFDKANTDVTNITISPSQAYGNATHIPIVTVSANGRINAISTVAVTATDPSAIAFAIALG